MITFEKNGVRFTYRVAGIAVDSGRVLLHRAEHEDFWALPGGRVEQGETASVALVREMEEELSADARIERLLWVVENFFEYEERRCHELGLYYLMSFPEGSPVYDNAGPFVGYEANLRLIFQWHDIDALADTPLYPTFLRERLRMIPATVEHVVHEDVKSA